MICSAFVHLIPSSVLMIRFDELKIRADELRMPFDVHMTIARFTMIASLFRFRRFDELIITTDALEERPAVPRVQGKDFSMTSVVSL